LLKKFKQRKNHLINVSTKVIFPYKRKTQKRLSNSQSNVLTNAINYICNLNSHNKRNLFENDKKYKFAPKLPDHNNNIYWDDIQYFLLNTVDINPKHLTDIRRYISYMPHVSMLKDITH
jgi:hypothetical protein